MLNLYIKGWQLIFALPL